MASKSPRGGTPEITVGDVIEDISRTAYAEAVSSEDDTVPVVSPESDLSPPKEAKGGFCVYLGPSIQGVIISGTVYSTDRKTSIAEMGSVLKRYPLVASLLVSGDVLPESRIKVKTPGNLLYANYNKLVGTLKMKQGGNRNA